MWCIRVCVSVCARVLRLCECTITCVSVYFCVCVWLCMSVCVSVEFTISPIDSADNVPGHHYEHQTFFPIFPITLSVRVSASSVLECAYVCICM